MNLKLFGLCVTLVFVGSSANALEKRINDLSYAPVLSTPLSSRFEMDRTITAVLQDGDGYLWFGTQSGLFRYDGKFIENAFDEFETSLVFSLFLDSEQTLWVGTQDGAAKYNSESKRFSSVRFSNPKGPAPRVFDFVERGEDLFMATSEGLFIVDDQGSTRLVHDLDGGIVRSLELDAENRMWIGTQRRGLYLDYNNQILKSEFEVDPRSIRELLIDSDQFLWIATFNDGLFRADVNSGTVQSLVADGLTEGSRTRALLQDKRGDVWVGADNGIYRWSKTNNSLSHVPSTSNVYTDDRVMVFDLAQDNAGTIWVGSYSGVVSIDPDYNVLRHVSLAGLESNGTIAAFAENDDGLVAIGTTNGLAAWDPARGVVFDYAEPVEFSSHVTALEFDENEDLWVGTYADGLYRIRDSKVVAYYDVNGDFSKHGVADILIAEDETIWIATAGAGIYSFDPGRDYFHKYPEDRSPSGEFPDLRCLAIRRDASGFFWVGTNDAGLFRFDPYTGDTVDYSSGLEKKSSNVLVTSDGVWTGAVTGQVHHLRFDSYELELLPLRLSAIYGLSEIGESLLIAGQKELLIYNRNSKESQLLDRRNGYVPDVTIGANIVLTSGEVLFGGHDGLNVVSERNLVSRYTHSPRVQVSNLKVNYKNFIVDYRKSIELSAEQNDLYLDYFITDYLFPDKLQSKYILEGFDEDWIQNGTNRSVTYTNLDPGSYVLRVRGTNSEGVWSPNELTLPIRISPPWWATWWAYWLYICAALFIFYQLLQLSTRRVNLEAESRFNQRLRHYVSALDDASECVLNASETGRILYVNDAIREVLGKTVSDAIGHSLFDVLFNSPEEKDRAREDLSDNGRYLREISFRDVHHDKTLEVSIRKGETRSEDDVTFVCVVRDVTERSQESRNLQNKVASLNHELENVSNELHEYVERSVQYRTDAEARFEQNEKLLRNIHDRINDNFQMLSSIFSIQSTKGSGRALEKVLDENQQRIKTIGLIHEQLSQSGSLNLVEMGDYVDVLVTSLYRGLASSMVQLELIKDIGSLELSIDQAVPAGLIVNELVSNALLHGFSGKTHGRGKLRVSLYELAGDCVLLVSDDGQGLPTDFQLDRNSGIGFEIVSILTKQLGGDFKLVGGIGTTFEVRFPVEPIS